MAVSLRLQLRSPPLVRDSLLPLMAPPLPVGCAGATTALPGLDPLPLALILEELAPPSLSVAGGLELDFSAKVYPTPLACCPPSKPKQKTGKSSPDWLLPMLEDS